MRTATGAYVIRAVVTVLLAAVALVVAVGPARAHADLRSSDPQDGATLEEAPSAMVFVFNEDVLDQGNAVTLTAVESDERLAVGPLEVQGDTVTVPWPEQSPAGQFRAAYRVVSADGHPIEGTVAFSVAQPVGPSTVPPSAVPATEPSAEPVPVAVAASAGAGDSSPAPTDTADAGRVGLLAWVIALGVAVVIGAAAGLWVMRRTR